MISLRCETLYNNNITIENSGTMFLLNRHECIWAFWFFVYYLFLFLLRKCFFYAPPQGRKARLKVTRSSTAAAQNRYSRGSPVSTYSPYSNHSSNNSMNRLPNGTSNFAGEEHSNGTFEPWSSECDVQWGLACAGFYISSINLFCWDMASWCIYGIIMLLIFWTYAITIVC